MEFAGLQDDHEGGWYELRHCPCRNTPAIVITAAQAAALLATR